MLIFTSIFASWKEDIRVIRFSAYATISHFALNLIVLGLLLRSEEFQRAGGVSPVRPDAARSGLRTISGRLGVEAALSSLPSQP